LTLLEGKMCDLCSKVGIEGQSTKNKLKLLRKNEALIHALKEYRIKSLIQTYDIRDAEKYKGVLELERMLHENEHNSVADFNNNIR
jgi:hypothetical protein